MKPTLLLAGLLALGLTSCGKKDGSAPAATTNAPATSTNKPAAGGNPLTAPVDYLGAVAKAKRFSEKTVDLVSLNRTIQQFQGIEDRLPKDLNELVAMRYLPALPVPPPGMRLVYNPTTGEVRAVR